MQLQRRIQLLVDDRPEQLPPDGQVGIAGALAGRILADPLLGQHARDQIRPTAHRTVGKFVAHAFGEAVADRHVPARRRRPRTRFPGVSLMAADVTRG